MQQARGAVLDRFVDHLADPVGIFSQPVGEIPGGEFFQGPEFKPLQAGKQLATQVLAHLQGRASQQGVLAELGDFLQHEHAQGQAHHPQHLGDIARTDRR